MDSPIYTVPFDYANPRYELVFNTNPQQRVFPFRLYGETSFVLRHTATLNGAPYNFTNFTTAELFVKVTDNTLIRTKLCDGVITSGLTATDGSMDFIVPKGILPNDYATYTDSDNRQPITLYFVIESSDNKKISLETQIAIMDIDRTGIGSTFVPDSSELEYVPDEPAKWVQQYFSAPVTVSQALDKLAFKTYQDQGIVLSEETVPPTSNDDDRYLVATGGTGVFATHDGEIAEYNNGTWVFLTPLEGYTVYVIGTGVKTYDGASWIASSSGSSSSNSEDINQTAHSFAKYDAVYHNGTNFSKALADDATTANVVGVVSSVADVDNFTVTYAGLVVWDTPPTPDYTLGSNLFLSNVTAGLITDSTLTYATGDVRQFIGTSLAGGLLVNISEGSEITESTAYPSEDATKVGYLTVTQAVNLNTMESDITNLSSGWFIIGTASYTATPSSTSTITMSDTSLLQVGQALRYTDGTSTRYAQIASITTDTSISIRGSALDTGSDLTSLYFAPVGKIREISLFISGTYADGTDTDLLANDMNSPFEWTGNKSYLVFAKAVHMTVDGTAQPKINIQLNGAKALTGDSNNGIQLGSSGVWVANSPVAISNSNYGIEDGQEVEVECTVAGTAGDAENLTVQLTFVES
jgi:hypothetical protein